MYLQPTERAQLQALLPSLDKGLDPTFAFNIVQGILQSQQQRLAQHQAAIQGGMQSLTQFATQNPSPQAASTYATAVAQASGLHAPGQESLQNFATSLYPTPNAPSPLYTPQSTGANLATLDMNAEIPNIDANLLQNYNAGNTLDETVTGLLQHYQLAGADQQTLASLVQYAQQQWQAMTQQGAPTG